jgi:hypothetical protein
VEKNSDDDHKVLVEDIIDLVFVAVNHCVLNKVFQMANNKTLFLDCQYILMLIYLSGSPMDEKFFESFCENFQLENLFTMSFRIFNSTFAIQDLCIIYVHSMVQSNRFDEAILLNQQASNWYAGLRCQQNTRG